MRYRPLQPPAPLLLSCATSDSWSKAKPDFNKEGFQNSSWSSSHDIIGLLCLLYLFVFFIFNAKSSLFSKMGWLRNSGASNMFRRPDLIWSGKDDCITTHVPPKVLKLKEAELENTRRVLQFVMNCCTWEVSFIRLNIPDANDSVTKPHVNLHGTF